MRARPDPFSARWWPVQGAPPDRLVLVAGTGTEVGKTWTTAALAGELRARGLTVAARKPAQSFDSSDVADGITDAHVLAAATGVDPAEVCPLHRWYEVPMAPPMAAAELHRAAFGIADLAAELHWPARPVGFGFVETAGGVRSPQAIDGDAVSLTNALEPDAVVLVADAGLGTVNAVRLTIEALHTSAHQVPILIFMNRFSPHNPLHQRNLRWLEVHDSLACEIGIAGLADQMVRASGGPADGP